VSGRANRWAGVTAHSWRIAAWRVAGMALVSVIALAADVAEAQQTIVGKWAIRSKCAAPLSTIVIEPLGLSGEDFSCSFKTVKRSGDTIQWQGTCNFSENGDEPSTVTAQLRGQRLYYRFAGMGWNGPFNRCR
jgi:hypothetical protein